MEWLQCYLAGEADCAALLPEYVPPGWQGDVFGLTLQAEEYDSGEGVVAAGDVVAYTDDGDWIKFEDVTFQDGWDTFWLRYAKGSDTEASISIHFDDPASPAVLTVPVPYTGGWNNFQEIELPFDAADETHDVYVLFNTPEDHGIANLDWLRFGRPEPQGEVNLVGDGGFEGANLDGGWSAFGSGAALSLSTDQAHAGSQSLLVDRSGLSGTGGFAAYWLTDKVASGTAYEVSAWVYQAGAGDDTVRLSAKVRCDGVDDYPWLDNNTAVPANTWTKLSGVLTIPQGCGLEEAQIYFEGTAEGVAVYIDDVAVVPLNLVTDGGFEGPTLAAGWSAFGSGAALSLSTDQAHAGSQSLLVDRSGVAGTGGYAAYDLTPFMVAGVNYLAEAWVYHTGAGDDTVRMSAKIGCADGDSFLWVDNNTAVPANTWTVLSGAFGIPLDCDIQDVQLYFEGTAAGVNVYIDDVSVTLPAENLVEDGGFESGSLDPGWRAWWVGGTSLSITSDRAYAGNNSLWVSNRVEDSHPSYNLTGRLQVGESYTVSARVLHTGAGDEPVTLTRKLTCETQDGIEEYAWVANVDAAAPNTWIELTGTIDVPASCGEVTEARIYFERTGLAADLYIDEVSIVEQ
ncbi:MAG: hypothetical protein KatS3mg121_0967 [Gammaproteobacteria bacterium]|nr:MAG: hypothetical protein KatS3mg121_0967 [Gammaproteobacteria bacterium]